jgi:glutathione synthase/RimK-type ligase-like ATP-grasp enzyme
MATLRIALATCAALHDLVPDDRLLAGALRARGGDVAATVWNDPAVDWSRFDRVVIRSVWDYHLRFSAFLAWLDQLLASGVAVVNPVPTLRWNARKRYLEDLARAGAAVVPTEFLAAGAAPRLGEVLDRRGWARAVVKPEVSASAHRTVRLSRAQAHARQADLERMLEAGPVLVQPYLEAVEDGEWSLVFLGGSFSHAVRKRPAPGDFRVQEEHGGRSEPALPPPAVLAHAWQVLGACPQRWTYARVDAVEQAGEPLLMELELIEPALFLGAEPGAAGRLADAILA